jgi:hypothetical protein
VGLEIRKSGRMNLLVLDPMFKTNPSITRLIGTKFNSPQPDKLLKAYRRGDDYLKKYHSFEMLKYVFFVPKSLTVMIAWTRTDICYRLMAPLPREPLPPTGQPLQIQYQTSKHGRKSSGNRASSMPPGAGL